MNESENIVPGTLDEGKCEDEFYSTIIDDKAMQMMEKMGYKIGIGLGKYEQGITKVLDIDSQIGTKGLGFSSKNFETEYDLSQEAIHVEESVEWIFNENHLDLSFEELKSFLKVGNSNENYTCSYDFCDQEVYDEIVKAKEVFNKFNIQEVNKARAKSNPFEKIHSVFFMNRAALKIANIDAVTNFMFTNIDKNVHHNHSKGPFFFADVCAGPGGFSEYVLWRRSWLFKGFGLTLREENDFQLFSSCCISPHSFQAFYGTQGDGNVCSPENIRDFKDKVLFQTDGLGVHFMTSDGGFCVDGVENFQEILSRNIYLCQCLVALEIVRTHGNFFTKLFDIFTRFSVGLIYLMYKCFEKVSILKPNSSRPANAERYLICSNLQNNDDVENIRRYLRFISEKLWVSRNEKDVDVLEIVCLEQIENDINFVEFIKRSNIEIGKKQLAALKKLDDFCKNRSLRETRQDELREKCLEYWQIPDISKKMCEFDNERANNFLIDFVQDSVWLKEPPVIIKSEKTILDIVNHSGDWSFCNLYSSNNKDGCNFYAGFSTRTCKWQDNKWVRTKHLKLWKGTLLFGELVKEVVESDKSEASNPHFKISLHIIDAVFLGDVCLNNKSFEERMELINIYAKSLNQEFQKKFIHIRKKPMYPLKPSFLLSIKENIDQYSPHIILPTEGYESKEESQDVNSIMFLKHQCIRSTFTSRSQLDLEEIEDIQLFNIMITALELESENISKEQMYFEFY